MHNQQKSAFVGLLSVLCLALSLFVVPLSVCAQDTNQQGQQYVEGTVTNDKGEPVVGAIIRDKANKQSAVTDLDGKFRIAAKTSRVTLDVSYLGLKPYTWRGTAGKRAKITMQEDNNTLQDVVVTGYQQLDRRNLTSSVVSKDMSELDIPGVSDLSKMLEGKIPDLVSLSSSGEINATTRIRIRGTSTLIGNREPLWVLDGIILTDPINLTTDVLNDPDYVNRIGNAIAGINPQDIKRIDVLKDAAATALYGTRAANGVIVITTKSGREGKPTVSYTGTMTVRKRPYYGDSKINLMNSSERVAFSQYLTEQHFQYPSHMPRIGYEWALQRYYEKQITRDEFLKEVDDMANMNTDWFDLLTHNSFSHDHSVSVSGGSEKVRYYTSVGFTDQDDVINDNLNRRFTAMTKIDMNLSKKFQLQFSANGYYNKRQYQAGDVNLINYAYNTSRTIPAYNDDGSYYYYERSSNAPGGHEVWLGYNILNENENSNTKQNTDGVTATVNLRYQPISDLFFNGVFSANISNGDVETWYGEKSYHSLDLKNADYNEDPNPNYSLMPYGGEFSKSHTHNVGWTARLQGNYNKYFGPDMMHNINFAVGFEASSSHYTGDSWTMRGYYKDRGRSFATNIPKSFTRYWDWMQTNVPSITDSKSNMVSAYATLSYSFKNLFTLNANGRYDGSNKFGSRSNDKLLPIWSVSGNANILNIFSIKAPWLDDWRLKASYGEQGNMLDDQTSELVIKKGGMNSFYNEMISNVANFANPDLKWEKTHSTNVGTDISMFHSRLQFSAEYYYKKTTDAFLSKPISDINGYTSYVINSGTITNSGFNFSVSGTPIRTKDFYWTISGNLSKVYNKVNTAPGADTYQLSNFLNGSAVTKGNPVGTFYSYHFLGLSPEDGGPLIEDWKDRQEEIKDLGQYDFYTRTLVVSGKREPDLTGSFSSSFTWREWRISASFLYNVGAKTRLFRIFNGASSNGFSSEANINRAFLDRWMKPGDELKTDIPSIIGLGNSAYYYYNDNWTSSGNYSGPKFSGSAWDMYDYSDARVVSANYLKLSTLSLTWDMKPEHAAKIGMQRIAVTLSGYNLKTWANKRLRGQTPTQGGFTEVQLSDTPSWTLGVTVSF